jgi:ATP-dependent exoDNAse (exonuclease V) beta subunit
VPLTQSAVSVSYSSFAKHNQFEIVHISIIPGFFLKQPLDAIVEPDEEGYIARLVDIRLYGYGDDRMEAIENLKNDLSELYRELNEDDNYSTEWMAIKKMLKKLITPWDDNGK